LITSYRWRDIGAAVLGAAVIVHGRLLPTVVAVHPLVPPISQTCFQFFTRH
jgi:hypothetical protein